MLERMDLFFEKRMDDYDEHMMRDITGAREFYPFTAAQLPMDSDASVLDLGCGTGLELEMFFQMNPKAKVTGIDLSAGMLEKLKNKFPEKKLDLICASYFDADLGEKRYNAAVSVESLHHFKADKKLSLYTKLCKALKEGGYFILTDYLAPSEEDERKFFRILEELKRDQGIDDGEFYHYDTPLTPEHEIDILKKAGFSSVTILCQWENTYTIKAIR